MTKKKKGGAAVEFYGTSELLKKIENAQGNIKEAVEKAIIKSCEPPEKAMLNFIANHRRTGLTERTFTRSQIVWEGDILKLKTGFDIKKGGLPAIFLNYGTPTQKPYFFIYNAVNDNLDEIKKIQVDTLNEILRELK